MFSTGFRCTGAGADGAARVVKSAVAGAGRPLRRDGPDSEPLLDPSILEAAPAPR